MQHASFAGKRRRRPESNRCGRLCSASISGHLSYFHGFRVLPDALSSASAFRTRQFGEPFGETSTRSLSAMLHAPRAGACSRSALRVRCPSRSRFVSRRESRFLGGLRHARANSGAGSRNRCHDLCAMDSEAVEPLGAAVERAVGETRVRVAQRASVLRRPALSGARRSLMRMPRGTSRRSELAAERRPRPARMAARSMTAPPEESGRASRVTSASIASSFIFRTVLFAKSRIA